jgi:DNA primase
LAGITDIAEEIKSRADIIEVIGRVVSLRKKGALWEGLCPFHNEKSPSFKVYETSQHYHCYGCGESGDVITFYEKQYNLDFLEAAEKLAAEYGIDWSPGGHAGGETEKSSFYEINRTAGIYYHSLLRKPGNPGFDYLAGRGIEQQTMKAFGLGYADGRNSDLTAHLKERGHDLDKAADIGLVIKDGNRYKDRYYNRVMYPIINTRGKVIGFGARTLDPDGKPKYLNSSESKIFLKKNNLYAINITKDVIVKEGTAIFVEGYMDVIALYQKGVRNVTASLGTALTSAQARMIRRYAGQVILAYDADSAGQDAALKGIDILRDAGLEVKVLILPDPETKDPDEFIRKHGRAAFAEAVTNASPATEYKLARTKERYDLGAKEGSVGFLQAAAAILRACSPVEADYYMKKLEVDTGISEGAIRMEVYGGDGTRQQERRTQGSRNSSGSRNEYSTYGSVGAESGESGRKADGGSVFRASPADEAASRAVQRLLIRLLMHDSSLASEVAGRERAFTSDAMLRIYTNIAALEKEARDKGADSGVEVSALADTLDEEDRGTLEDIMRDVIVTDDPAQQMKDCISKLDLIEMHTHEKDIIEALKVTTGDEEEVARLMSELVKVQSRIRLLKER